MDLIHIVSSQVDAFLEVKQSAQTMKSISLMSTTMLLT